MIGGEWLWLTNTHPKRQRWAWSWRWNMAHASHSERGETARPLRGSDAARATTPATLDFAVFFERYEARIVGYLWRMTGDEQLASDLCQETFLRAWQHFAQISAYDRPDAWLYRVATNFALQHLRRHSAAIHAATPLDAEHDLAGSDPGRRFIESDLVRQILLVLPPRQRAALVLREVLGLSCDEVGRALGVSRDAAKMLLLRAREQFRAHYLRENGED